VPLDHRASAVDCSHDRGAGDADPSLTFAECTTDADCTAGDNGRCVRSQGGALTNYCSYDLCFADGDCAASQVCGCRAVARDANTCLGGDCVIDPDCGAGAYCSPSRGFDRINYPVVGYYCHSSSDECVDDADCRVDAGGDARCTYFPDRTHWACSTMGFYPP